MRLQEKRRASIVLTLVFTLTLHVSLPAFPIRPPPLGSSRNQDGQSRTQSAGLDLREYMVGNVIEVTHEDGRRIEGTVIRCGADSLVLRVTGIWKQPGRMRPKIQRGEEAALAFEEIERIDLAPPYKPGVGHVFLIGFITVGAIIGTIILVLYESGELGP